MCFSLSVADRTCARCRTKGVCGNCTAMTVIAITSQELEHRLDRRLEAAERNRIGVTQLRRFLEQLLQRRYSTSAPAPAEFSCCGSPARALARVEQRVTACSTFRAS